VTAVRDLICIDDHRIICGAWDRARGHDHRVMFGLAALIVVVVVLRLSGVAGAAEPQQVASGIPFPTNIAFDAKGGMWLTSGAGGVSPSDGVWYAPKHGRPRHVVRHLTTALGLRWVGNTLYVAHITSRSNGRVTAFKGFNGRHFTKRAVAINGLRVGRHDVNTIVLGPDRRLYVGVGSTFDNHGLPGRVYSWAPGKHHVELEATGLRNPYGLAFHGSQLLVTDNGLDFLGDDIPPEELNAFDPAGPVIDFGFPDCWDQGGPACDGKVAPIATLPAHASSDGLAVKGNVAYVAQNGSTYRKRAVGSDVQRVDLLTGEAAQLWRSPVAHDPLGAAIGPDGRLYVTLFLSGKVVRFDV
jgi:glucose/arabinose dehydrogenase